MSITLTLFDEINSNPHSNVGHNSWVFEKLFFVKAIDEYEQKNKNIKINNFCVMSKGAFCRTTSKLLLTENKDFWKLLRRNFVVSFYDLFDFLFGYISDYYKICVLKIVNIYL